MLDKRFGFASTRPVAHWLCYDTSGQLVGQCASLEINPEVIRQLKWHRTAATDSTH